MLQRLTHREWVLQAHKHPYLGYRFDPATGTSKPDIPTDFRYLRKHELSPEDLKTLEEIKEKGKDLAPEVLDSLVQGFIKSKLKGVSHGSDGCACAVGLGKSGVESEPGPGPGPGEKKAVATGPRKRAKVKKLYIAPVDVVKYFRKEEPLLGWEDVLRAMYFVSWYDVVKGRRIFNKGVEWLADRCGITKRQVIEITGRMKVRRDRKKKGEPVKGIIKLRGRGWPGEGCSRWELPHKMALVMKWRRNLPKK